MDHPAFFNKTDDIISKTEKPPNLMRGKDLERVCSAEVNVSSYVLRVYDKNKKYLFGMKIYFKNSKDFS
jgi:hypothetical protein